MPLDNGSIKPVNGILLLYHHPLRSSAATVMEHVNAFTRHSRLPVCSVNTALGFPAGLRRLRFQIVVLHYSLFSTGRYYLNQQFLRYLADSVCRYKIAFFQDEHRYCQPRFAFLNRYKIDCVYTLLEPAYFQDVYQKYTAVPKLVYTLAGYVSDDLVAIARALTKPDHQRTIDVGYRGRRLDFYMGQGAQEKHEIATGFVRRASTLGLQLDIAFEEHQRIYGRTWYEFLANCRAVLGVEAGVSIFDLQDTVRTACERLLVCHPRLSFAEVFELVLRPWENNVPYRTISPRHFEAAALRVCQILFAGQYSGIMQPMVHYIPLQKDFSNFAEVIRMFRDEELRHVITENAYRDLIASGQYTYQKFIESFEQELWQAGYQPNMPAGDAAQVTALLKRGKTRRYLCARVKETLSYPLYRNRRIRFLAQPFLRLYRRYRRIKPYG